MKVIHDIILDFYNCCNLPISAINTDFKEVDKIGFSPEIQVLFKKEVIHQDIMSYPKDALSYHLEYDNHIHVLVVPISRYDKYKGYFLVGPLTTDKNAKSRLPFRPAKCVTYLPSILLNIADHNFSKGMSDLSFSIHVKKGVEYIHKNYTQAICLDELCSHLGVNKSYFCKVFKKETTFTFSNFLNNYRIEKSKYFLQRSDLSLMDIAISVGFNTQNYYSMTFKKFTGKTPLEYRKQAQ